MALQSPTAGAADNCAAVAPVLVLGLGNPLLGDDGAGLAILDELVRQGDGWGGAVEFLDGGTQGLALLAHFRGRGALLVLDAMQCGADPGSVHVLRGWNRATARASTAHESNAAELLQAAELLGELPPHVIIVGIEPDCLQPGIGLSAAVGAAADPAVEAAKTALKEIIQALGTSQS